MSASSNGPLRSLAAIAVGSAAAGFGWSAGRDLYRKGKDWVLPAIAIAAVAGGAGYAAWNLTRGHRRPSVLRTLGAVLAAGGSLVLCAVVLGGAAGRDPARATGGGALLLAVGIQTASALTGLLVGLSQRGRRIGAFSIEAHNLDFMSRAGIRDVGGREQTYIDGSGTELRLDDVRRDAMVFRVPGRRGLRAYIDLDGHGRMTGYRPPV